MQFLDLFVPVNGSCPEFDYQTIDPNETEFAILDHWGIFTLNFTVPILDYFKDKGEVTIWSQFIIPETVKHNYPNVTFKFVGPIGEWVDILLRVAPHISKVKKFENFICCFSGTDNQIRKLLVSALYKLDWYNPNFCSKNFNYTLDEVYGNLFEFIKRGSDKERFYSKFFADDSVKAKEFYSTIQGFEYRPLDHVFNVNVLADKINRSFVQLVNETNAHSTVPYVTEKIAYPIICQSLWVACAPHGYHEYLEKYYGFRKYTKVFDYKFDQIINPVERVIELLCMLSKFKTLSKQDWSDLWDLEKETIQYNYDHYVSRRYHTELAKHASLGLSELDSARFNRF